LLLKSAIETAAVAAACCLLAAPSGVSEAGSAQLRWRYGAAILGVALIVLSAQLSSMFVTRLRQPCSTQILIQHSASQQRVTGHPPVNTVAEKLDCEAALRSPAGKPYTLDGMQLSRYTETGGTPLLLHNHSDAIMGWIMGNPGERKVHEVFRHLLGTGAWQQAHRMEILSPSRQVVPVGHWVCQTTCMPCTRECCLATAAVAQSDEDWHIDYWLPAVSARLLRQLLETTSRTAC
jgi:hypothetical protein